MWYLPPSDLQSDRYLFSRYWTAATFAWITALFDSNSNTVGQIAKLTAAGDRAAKTAQSTFWSCHDPIGTMILKLSESWTNHNMEPWSLFNPAKKLPHYVLSRLQPSINIAGRGFCQNWNPTKVNSWTQPRPLQGCTDHLLTLPKSQLHWRLPSQCILSSQWLIWRWVAACTLAIG